MHWQICTQFWYRTSVFEEDIAHSDASFMSVMLETFQLLVPLIIWVLFSLSFT